MIQKLTILVVDDDPGQAKLLAGALQRMGHSAQPMTSPEEALESIRQSSVHLVISDLRMQGTDGLSFLRLLKENDPDIDVLLVTAFASVGSAVEAMRIGALDYLEKPIDLDLLSAKLKAVQERVSLKMENRHLRAQLKLDQKPALIGKSPVFQAALEKLSRASESEAPVLILGESGTGKEIFARRLHFSGRRARGAFIPVNCGAIPENLVESEFFGHVKGAFTGADKNRAGTIEEADDGTIFLDEIGELPLSVQPKLLRVIQEGELCRLGSNKILRVNVRWVAATHRNLAVMVKEGKFREDLYYRLAVIPVSLPPLRERPADIPLFVEDILAGLAHKYGRPLKTCSAEVLEAFQVYSWPGNVRELENTLERLFFLAPGDTFDLADLPSEFVDSGSGQGNGEGEGMFHRRVIDLERQLIQEALQASRGNQSEAARRLGLQERTLRYKLRKLGIPSASNQT